MTDKARGSIKVFTLVVSRTSSLSPLVIDWLGKKVLNIIAFSLVEQCINFLPSASMGGISLVEA